METNDAAAESKWAQLDPLSGAVFIGLYVVGSLLIASFEFLPPPDQAVSFFENDSFSIAAEGYIGTV